jgi:DNA-binding MarR family transcriptional regulator
VTAVADPRAERLAALRGAFGELLGAERRLRARDQHREGAPLSHHQVRALIVLGDHGDMTAGELARAAELNAGTITGMLDRLEAAGLVERRRSPSDRRCVLVTLTQAGKAMHLAERDRARAMWEEHLGGASDEELAGAVRVVRELAAMLDAI